MVGQLVHTLVEVRAVCGRGVMGWAAAVDGSRGEVGVVDVLVLVALLAGGEEDEEEAVWRCLCRCVATKRLPLLLLRAVLSPPWLDVLSSHIPALSVLCRRLLSASDPVLRDWARQLLPGVFTSLPASQVEMRRILLSGCSKSYQAATYSGATRSGAATEETEEQRFLFNRSELCGDVFLRIAHYLTARPRRPPVVPGQRDGLPGRSLSARPAPPRIRDRSHNSRLLSHRLLPRQSSVQRTDEAAHYGATQPAGRRHCSSPPTSFERPVDVRAAASVIGWTG